MSNEEWDFRDTLAIFFRAFILVIIIQSFLKNDRPFGVTLIWALGLPETVKKKNKNMQNLPELEALILLDPRMERHKRH